MEIIAEGLNASTAEAYILGMLRMLLLFFMIGTIGRCIVITLNCMMNGSEIKDLTHVLRKRIMAAIFAGCAAEVLAAIERAYR